MADSPQMDTSVPEPGLWAGLVPASVTVVEAADWMWEAAASTREALLVRRALPTRVREFRAGRAAARGALAQLGISGFDLMAGDAGNPLWPPGVVGSITHTRDYCAVAVARAEEVRAVGIDAEPDEPIEAELIPQICLPAELADNTAAVTGTVRLARLIFTIKEAFYKAYYPVASTFLDFLDVAVTLDATRGRFEAVLQNDRVPRFLGQDSAEGRFVLRQGLVLAAVVVGKGGPFEKGSHGPEASSR